LNICRIYQALLGTMSGSSLTVLPAAATDVHFPAIIGLTYVQLLSFPRDLLLELRLEWVVAGVQSDIMPLDIVPVTQAPSNPCLSFGSHSTLSVGPDKMYFGPRYRPDPASNLPKWHSEIPRAGPDPLVRARRGSSCC